jgi:hypothetical protein
VITCFTADPQATAKRVFEHLCSLTLPVGPPTHADQLPHCDVDFISLFQCLRPEQIVTLVELMLADRSILFVSKVLQQLSEAVQAFVALLYPFPFPHAYTALLPADEPDLPFDVRAGFTKIKDEKHREALLSQQSKFSKCESWNCLSRLIFGSPS